MFTIMLSFRWRIWILKELNPFPWWIDWTNTTKMWTWKGKPNLVNFPPDFSPIPCKPLFFDIALNHVEFPSLDHKLESGGAAGGAGGLSGWLWGWGKK